MMIRKLLPLLFTLLTVAALAQEKREVTTLILVRHAEKADDGTKDPPLSEAGKERTRALVNLLRETPVDVIYTTPYNRTRETVAPLAILKGKTLREYKPHDWDELQKIIKENKGKTIVMAGHSNTTPWVARVLTGNDYPDWKDDDYNNVLIVSVVGEREANVVWLTYGDEIPGK